MEGNLYQRYLGWREKRKKEGGEVRISQRAFAEELAEAGDVSSVTRARRKIYDDRVKLGVEAVKNPRPKKPKSQDINLTVEGQDRTAIDLVEAAGFEPGEYEITQVSTWEQSEDGIPRISVKFRPVSSPVLRDVLQEAAEELRTHEFQNWPQPKASSNEYGDILLEICPFDPHFGKRAATFETGEEYNFEIAKELWEESLRRALAGTPNPGRILLILGNDMFHVDNLLGTTTAGTPQDSHMGIRQLFRAVTELLHDTIYNLAQHTSQVDILCIPGNHDNTVMFFMSELLAAVYEKNPNVSVINDARARQYYQWGKCLIGYTHGHQGKVNDLPLLMANEAASAWSETRFREWHIGHFHKENVLSYNGVTVRRIPSLVGADRWHHEEGYHAIRKSQAFVWDKKKGCTTVLQYNIG